MSLGYQTGSLWSRLQQNRMKHDTWCQLVWPLDIAFLCMMVLWTLQRLGLDYISLHKFRYYAYLQFHLPDPQYQRNVHIHTYTQLKHTYVLHIHDIYMMSRHTRCLLMWVLMIWCDPFMPHSFALCIFISCQSQLFNQGEMVDKFAYVLQAHVDYLDAEVLCVS